MQKFTWQSNVDAHPGSEAENNHHQIVLLQHNKIQSNHWLHGNLCDMSPMNWQWNRKKTSLCVLLCPKRQRFERMTVNRQLWSLQTQVFWQQLRLQLMLLSKLVCVSSRTCVCHAIETQTIGSMGLKLIVFCISQPQVLWWNCKRCSTVENFGSLVLEQAWSLHQCFKWTTIDFLLLENEPCIRNMCAPTEKPHPEQWCQNPLTPNQSSITNRQAAATAHILNMIGLFAWIWLLRSFLQHFAVHCKSPILDHVSNCALFVAWSFSFILNTIFSNLDPQMKTTTVMRIVHLHKQSDPSVFTLLFGNFYPQWQWSTMKIWFALATSSKTNSARHFHCLVWIQIIRKNSCFCKKHVILWASEQFGLFLEWQTQTVSELMDKLATFEWCHWIFPNQCKCQC